MPVAAGGNAQSLQLRRTWVALKYTGRRRRRPPLVPVGATERAPPFPTGGH